jgi:hypothetical protein
LFPELELDGAETIAFQAPCEPLFSSVCHRQIGGRVTVTNSRFVFVPNRLDGLLGGKGIDIAREDNADVTVATWH